MADLTTGGGASVRRCMLSASSILAAVLLTTSAHAQTNYGAGSLIIPMDTTHQDFGMFKAFGLVYALLRADVPVDWVIAPGKTIGQADFTATATDFTTGASVGTHGYRGGPFVVKAADASMAAPIVTAWQEKHVTTVHVASLVFVGQVRRALVTAPSIAVFADGNEDIAFSYLNAAAIPDSTGKPWPTKKLDDYSAWPDVMTVQQVAGETTTDHADGSLFDDAANPLYCQLMTMHWGVKDAVDEVVAEMRSFLNHPTHLFAECQAVNAIENNPNGRFLTPKGYLIDGAPSKVEHHHFDYAFAQMDGAFGVVGGSEPSFSIPPGDSYYVDDVVMLTEAGSPIGKRDVWMTGYIDGACPMTSTVVVLGSETEAPGEGDPPPDPGLPPTAPEPCTSTKGKVSYLGGHKYTITLPISTNPKSQGTRLFLNSLFEADCAVAEGQPNVSLHLTGPSTTLTASVTYAIDFVNYGPFPLLAAEVSLALPDGATLSSADAGGTHEPATSSVRWVLGNQAVGAGATLDATIVLPVPGSYELTATLSYVVGVNTKGVSSAPVVTLYDTDSDGDGCPDAAELATGTLVDDEDTDEDGLLDSVDICPTVWNPSQDIESDPDHCGDCSVACETPNGTPACENGDCILASCDDDWLDCDGTPATGCETAASELMTSPLHCGACGVSCLGDNSEGSCAGGVCKLTCHLGFEDLDGIASTGCECNIAPESGQACADGVDNDCDGLVDGEDDDCTGATDAGDVMGGDAGGTADDVGDIITAAGDGSGSDDVDPAGDAQSELDVAPSDDVATAADGTGPRDDGAGTADAGLPGEVMDFDAANDRPGDSDVSASTDAATAGDAAASDAGGSSSDTSGSTTDILGVMDAAGSNGADGPTADQTSSVAIRGGGGCTVAVDARREPTWLIIAGLLPLIVALRRRVGGVNCGHAESRPPRPG